MVSTIGQSASAQTEAWPSKPVRYIVPFSTRNWGLDGVARLIAAEAGRTPGATGRGRTVRESRASSAELTALCGHRYTIMGGTYHHACGEPILQREPGPVKDFAPVWSAWSAMSLVIAAGSRFNSVAITAELKARPNDLCRRQTSSISERSPGLHGDQVASISPQRSRRAMVDLPLAGRSTWCSKPWPPPDMIDSSARQRLAGRHIRKRCAACRACLSDRPGSQASDAVLAVFARQVAPDRSWNIAT